MYALSNCFLWPLLTYISCCTLFFFGQLEDGDIICLQKSSQVGSSEQYRYPDVPSFLEYVHNRQVQTFSNRILYCFSYILILYTGKKLSVSGVSDMDTLLTYMYLDLHSRHSLRKIIRFSIFYFWGRASIEMDDYMQMLSPFVTVLWKVEEDIETVGHNSTGIKCNWLSFAGLASLSLSC